MSAQLQPDERVHAVVRDLVRDAAVEVISLKGAEDSLRVLPAGSTVTITCSPKLGLARTLEHSVKAAAAGFHVVPHLSARQIAGEAELRSTLGRLASADIADVYVVGGDDAEPAGDFRDAGDLLEALASMEHHLESVGIGCYPEGHPKIDDEALLRALLRKQPHAHYMVNQLCFEPALLLEWLRHARAEGVTLPLHVGLASPLKTRKLAELSLRIGVGSSLRFLTKQQGVVGNLVLGSSYRPENFLLGLGEALLPDGLGIASVHLFSFNQTELTVEWQRRVAGGPWQGAPR